jgi:anti-anti-sigma regulatory factor
VALVIRIAMQDGAGVLSVAGDLVGEWVALLEQECAGRLATHPQLGLDLSELRRVDEAGVEALRRLRKQGARIGRCPRVISELIGGEGSDSTP